MGTVNQSSKCHNLHDCQRERQPEADNLNNRGSLLISPIRLSHKARPPQKERKRGNIPQEEMAKDLAMSRTPISQIEYGKVQEIGASILTEQNSGLSRVGTPSPTKRATADAG